MVGTARANRQDGCCDHACAVPVPVLCLCCDCAWAVTETHGHFLADSLMTQVTVCCDYACAVTMLCVAGGRVQALMTQVTVCCDYACAVTMLCVAGGRVQAMSCLALIPCTCLLCRRTLNHYAMTMQWRVAMCVCCGGRIQATPCHRTHTMPDRWGEEVALCVCVCVCVCCVCVCVVLRVCVLCCGCVSRGRGDPSFNTPIGASWRPRLRGGLIALPDSSLANRK